MLVKLRQRTEVRKGHLKEDKWSQEGKYEEGNWKIFILGMGETNQGQNG